eukprot:7535053-Ditylum_brightwellii.AAC.1
MPWHAITTMFGMTRCCFNFIWRHFHVQGKRINYQDDPFASREDDDSDEEDFVETRDDESVDASDDELIDDGDGDGEKGKVKQEDVDSE